jgi:hypothetical protein
VNLNKKQIVIVILFILLSIELIPLISFDRDTLEISYLVDIQVNEQKNYTLLLPTVGIIPDYKFYRTAQFSNNNKWKQKESFAFFQSDY